MGFVGLFCASSGPMAIRMNISMSLVVPLFCQ